jgi:transposase
MEAIIERCCGLDVHQGSITACVLLGRADAKPEKHRATFGTMTHDLHELRKWLQGHGCTHVAMESTGVYWMPVYKVLEGHFELIVGNAQHLAKVPGRKTDMLDSEWLAELLRHGLIRKSFIPPRPFRDLRDLTRYRRKLVGSRSSERNRLQKLLETANIKLASVMSDVFCVSGMAMLRALVDGELSPKQMSQLARGSLRKKQNLLALALDGTFDEHHQFLLRTQLDRMEQLEQTISEVERRIEDRLEPYREQYERLMQIPGVSRVVASVFIAELGVDMSVFNSDEACASWVGVCPGNNESAGKRKSGRTRRGNVHLKTALVEAAQSAARKKGSYLRDKFHRLRARSDYQTAAMAVAHRILIAAYHMLAKGEDYRDLGEGYLDQKNQRRTVNKLVNRLERFGYHVTLEPRELESDAACTEAEAISESNIAAREPVTRDSSLSPEGDDAKNPVGATEAGIMSAAQDCNSSSEPACVKQEVQSHCADNVQDSTSTVRPGKAASDSSPVIVSTAQASVESAPTGERPSDAASPPGPVAVSSAQASVASASAPVGQERPCRNPEPIAVSSSIQATVQFPLAPAQPRGHDVASEPAGDTNSRPSAAEVQASTRKRQSRSRRAGRTTATRQQSSRAPRDPRLPPPGTLLTRVYKGVEHRVRVIEDGFEYQGTEYASISVVAKAITGTKWNGFRFFRLTERKKRRSQSK